MHEVFQTINTILQEHFVLALIINALIPSGCVIAILKYSGKAILKQIIEDILSDYYDNSLKAIIVDDLKPQFEDLKEELMSQTEDALELHQSNCKNNNQKEYDEKYFTRREFVIYLNNSEKQYAQLMEEIRLTRASLEKFISMAGPIR